jgi:hypothetical protein
MQFEPRHWAQVVNELPLGRIVQENLSSIPGRKILGQALLTSQPNSGLPGPASPGNQSVNTEKRYSMQII